MVTSELGGDDDDDDDNATLWSQTATKTIAEFLSSVIFPDSVFTAPMVRNEERGLDAPSPNTSPCGWARGGLLCTRRISSRRAPLTTSLISCTAVPPPWPAPRRAGPDRQVGIFSGHRVRLITVYRRVPLSISRPPFERCYNSVSRRGATFLLPCCTCMMRIV